MSKLNDEAIKQLKEICQAESISESDYLPLIAKALATNFVSDQKEKGLNLDAEARVEIDPNTYEIKMLVKKDVVESVYSGSESFEISLKDAKELDPEVEIGMEMFVPYLDDPLAMMSRKNFAATTQSFKHGLRDLEKRKVENEIKDLVNNTVYAIVEKIDENGKHAILRYGKHVGYLGQDKMIPNEKIVENQRLLVTVVGTTSSLGYTSIEFSRVTTNIIHYLFERDIPEIAEGILEVKRIVRMPGVITKVAVSSRDKNIDAVLTCMGQSNDRLNSIRAEINDEILRVINYYNDLGMMILEAFKPLIPLGIIILDKSNIQLVVNDEDIAASYGKRRSNCKIAKVLTLRDIRPVQVSTLEGRNYITCQEIKYAYEERMAKEEEENKLRLQENRLRNIERASGSTIAQTDLLVEGDNVEDGEEIIEITRTAKEMEAFDAYRVQKANTNQNLLDLENIIEREAKQAASRKKKKYIDDEEVEDELSYEEYLKQEKERIEKARQVMPVYTEEELQMLDEDEDEEYILVTEDDEEDY